jgi:AraC-like DNA-binding protein
MNRSEALPLFDAALRGALIALMLLVGIRLARDRIDAPAARVGTLLMACLSVQVFASLPMMEHTTGPWSWQAPLVGVSVGNSVLFWVFAQSLFDDDFVLRPLHFVAWLAVIALGILFYAVVVMPQQRQLAPFALAVAIAMRWTPLVFAALAVAAAASQWRADLVERRRRLRVFIVAMGTGYTVMTAVARLASKDGRLSDWMSSLDIAVLLVIVGTIAARVLRIVDTELLPHRPTPSLPPAALDGTASSPAPAPKAAGPVAGPAVPDPAEDLLAAQLQRLMAEDRAYRTEDLTVARLAALLHTPEYRLRRLINQRLGHRNFNAFVNGFRLDEAQRALADPTQRDVPVLTIALDAGFQSIGPFNRAFKTVTGLTPTEFRRQELADS